MTKWHHPDMKSVDNFGQKTRKKLRADSKTHLHQLSAFGNWTNSFNILTEDINSVQIFVMIVVYIYSSRKQHFMMLVEEDMIKYVRFY